MYQELKNRAWLANRQLPEQGLATLTFGNASEADRRAGVFAIKPSGVPYGRLKPRDMVVVDFKGRIVEGACRPSSDTRTHVLLYDKFPKIGGIVHTHALYSTAFSQAGRPITCLGTTQADNFFGPIPVTRALSREEVAGDYETNTGRVIVEYFRKSRLDPMEIPGVLVLSHGPFSWGPDAAQAVENAVIMEQAARMAVCTYTLKKNARPIAPCLLTKHFRRKHGATAYYGQKVTLSCT